MKTTSLKQIPFKFRLSRQRGISLIISMVLLLVLAVLGLAAMHNSTLQERMSNNMRDHNVALQAAELALRDAERDLAALKADGVTFCAAGSTGCRPAGERAALAADRAGYWAWSPALTPYWTSICVHGQCYDNTAASVPVWDDTAADWNPQAGSTGTRQTVAYGTYTGATAITGLAAQPRYIIEIFPASPNDVYGLTSQRVTFRITARAVGQNPKTIVILQSVSSP